jgi:hypothetical protein
MIIELVIARGIRIWIDGENSSKSWSCGGGDDDRISCSGLEIGGLVISEIQLDGPFYDGVNYKSIRLRTSKGDIVGQVVLTANDYKAWGSELVANDLDEFDDLIGDNPVSDQEDVWAGEGTVKLVNGKPITVDETQLYLKAVT